MRKLWAVPFLAGLAACSSGTEVPRSETGVGFGSYSSYQQQLAEREAAQQAAIVPGPKISEESTAPAPAPTVVAGAQPAPAPLPGPDPAIASDQPATDPASDPWAQVPSAKVAPPPQTPGEVTDQNNFALVSSERTRHQDAQRLERNREQYVVIQPTDLPRRPGTNIPNIVAYALASNNPVGEPLFKRGPFDTEAASARSCARFTSADLAQEAFLSAGGPQRDPKKLDPDGDGFACRWDPTPFRAVRNQG